MARRSLRLIAAALLGCVVALAGAITLNMLGRYTGITVEAVPPEDLLALLEPHFEVTTPEGEGPFPTALLFSGCDGPQDNVRAWGAALREAGWASILVDSHTPRGLEEPQGWALVCAGQVLTGAERAGDVAVALAHARTLPFVDPLNIGVVGASHGGWAVMEALALWDNGMLPLTLERWPDGTLPPGEAQVNGAVLLYPYCGELSRANWLGWETPIPVLFLLVEGDMVADETDCLEIIDRETRRGLPVTFEVYTGVTHAFDHKGTLEYSPSEYDAEATRRALSGMVDYLNATLPKDTP